MSAGTILNLCLFCRNRPRAPPIIEVPDINCYKTDSDLGECIICYEDMGSGECVSLISCGHAFHPLCLNAWFLKREVCPICQVPLKI